MTSKVDHSFKFALGENIVRSMDENEPSRLVAQVSARYFDADTGEAVYRLALKRGRQPIKFSMEPAPKVEAEFRQKTPA